MSITYPSAFFALVLVLAAQGVVIGVELATLSPSTWDEFAPQGKEVDCIYGDFVMRNEQIVVVIARPIKGRNANMTVRGTSGMIIDLTRRDVQNDQLSAFYAGVASPAFDSIEKTIISRGPNEQTVSHEGVAVIDQVIQGRRVRLEFVANPRKGAPRASVSYELVDSYPFVNVSTRYENKEPAMVTVDLRDSVRADRSFEFGTDQESKLFWAYDEWFRQAYGIFVPGHQPSHGGDRNVVVQYTRNGKSSVSIDPGEMFTLTRSVFPEDDLLQVLSVANRLANVRSSPVAVNVRDAAGPVANAKITVLADKQAYGWARTSGDGAVSFELPNGRYQLQVDALGRPQKTVQLDAADAARLDVELDPCGYVAAIITDETGGPIPCKVAFHGKDGTESPFFGPDSSAVAVHNLHYSHNGRFRQEMGPGTYDVIISYGPEFDAVFTQLDVRPGHESELRAKLVRTVDTSGWISSDFHSHSSPSGDNTSMQLGRVLNLLCEHIEFAPCTEHNRLSTYRPHLVKLGVEHLLASCVGMELTGSPGSVNHQNAFPLIRKPRTQDGGAPLTDENPVAQIERLALWDDASDKLVQTNHPTLPQIFGDRDQDTQPDAGFKAMFGFMDVIEVHPPAGILSAPTSLEDAYQNRNAIFHWMQLLNLGYRIPGVVNTDAHYNFHGSGGLRNYVKSRTDNPADIDTMDMVHASEAGHIVMTNGPFMEVTARSVASGSHGQRPPAAIPGDDLLAPGGKATLSVRVQCANWLDINRVQVFLNGKPSDSLNFTRRTTPQHFSTAVVKFEATIPLELSADAHVIVASAGEDLQLGRVMGPEWGPKIPVAVSNPIFVDTDGNGFQPNHDQLGLPLPTVER